MKKMEALHNFYNSFGIPAYPVNRVPNDVIFPYLTYENAMGNRGKETNPRVVLWYHTESEKAINDKAEEIQRAIGDGFSVKTDSGSIYVYFNEAWQPLTDDLDRSITGRYTNLLVVFNTL